MLYMVRSISFFGLMAFINAKQDLGKYLLNISINNNNNLQGYYYFVLYTSKYFFNQFLNQIIIIMRSNDPSLDIQKNHLASLYQAKTNYEQLISKYQSLPKIIEQKRQIIKNLKLSNHKLINEVAFRTEQLDQLIKRLEQFQRMEFLTSTLEEKQRVMESQFQDYQQLNSKLQKEVKLLQSQSQVLRGKAIIEYNKITEAREELSNQIKKKQILEKHLQEIKKNGQLLKKKIKTLRQQQRRRVSNKQRVKQLDLQKQVNGLRESYQQSKRQFEVQSNTVYVNQEQYNEIKEQLSTIRQLNSNYEEEERNNKELKKQQEQLESRILYLESISIEFINNKKVMLVQLKEKYQLSYAKKHSQAQNIEKLEKELAELQLQCPEGLIQLKKNVRKKKEPKQKTLKKSKQMFEQPIEHESEQKPLNFKCNKIKRLCWWLSLAFLGIGVIISHSIGYII